MSKSKTSPEKHIAVLPFPIASHPRSLFNLVCKLAISSPSIQFSFFGTEKCNTSLFSPPNSPDIPNNIKAYIISDGIPSGHVLSKHPLEEVELFLKSAPENCRKALDMANAERENKFTCLITDAFIHFAVDIAEDLKIPWIPVWTASLTSLSAHFYSEDVRKFCGSCPDDHTLEAIPGLSVVRVKDLPDEIISDDIQNSLFATALRGMNVLQKAAALVVSSFEELSSEAFKTDFNSKIKNLLLVGFLSIPQIPPPLNQSSDSDETGCLSWLDKQATASVAYVGFGTVATPPPHELAALAEALEESEVPFLWSLKDEQKAILPTGFLERTKCGKIVTWAPQMQVLAHSSVGVYITHSGWNSVCESIVCGVPMIFRPLIGDNRMIGRTVELEWEIGTMVDGGVITKSGLMRNLESVLGGQSGQKMRAKVRDLKSVVLHAAGPNGSGTRNFNTLLKFIS